MIFMDTRGNMIAALVGMEVKLDLKWTMTTEVLELEWHSALAARDMLMQCPEGERWERGGPMIGQSAVVPVCSQVDLMHVLPTDT